MNQSPASTLHSLAHYEKGDRGKKTILHIDDDAAICRLVTAHLANEGIISIGCTDPRIALKTIVEQGIRVVVLDIDMPHVDGITLLRKIKSMDAGVQVIMCTGMVSLTTVFNSTGYGAEACIFKPITNLSLISDAVNAAFSKIDRWWKTFDQWLELRRSQKILDSQFETYESQSNTIPTSAVHSSPLNAISFTHAPSFTPELF